MKQAIEAGTHFRPHFDAAGLVTAVVTDADSGGVLMVAHMNREAIDRTLQTGQVHFWSRSRQQLWLKGETSGHFLTFVEMRVDCDQDALWIIARPAGPACHTGAPNCFYRRVVDLETVEDLLDRDGRDSA
ncbi:MAG: phosphoribosyl-AMP cyclohydrolase [Sphingopyxis sp.]|nr:phosphoribosyl-AMP cyclohydrolase [Sphingopyxis sp.]